jgi:outer membrane lipoprotein-sorting protein
MTGPFLLPGEKLVKQNLMVRAVLCALLFVAPAFAFQMPVPFSADMSTTSAHGNLNITGKVYFSLPNMRMEMNTPSQAKSSGGKRIVIVDSAAKKMYMVMAEKQMYMEFSTDQDSPMTQRMPSVQDMLKSGDMCAGDEGATCKKIGTESVDGRPCEKWLKTEKSGKTETFWLDQKLHFPIKMSVGDTTTVYTNIKEGAQDASLFKVPAGLQKLDMGATGGRPSH